jgi:ribonuclease P protein component
MADIKPIKGFNSFNLVFKSGKKFYASELVGVFVYHNSNKEATIINNCIDENTFYYGVTAGKKHNKKAVVRNRIKRLLRESIRRIFKERYAEMDKMPFKYAVFSWRKGPETPSLIGFNDVFRDVELVFNSAEKYSIQKGATN